YTALARAFHLQPNPSASTANSVTDLREFGIFVPDVTQFSRLLPVEPSIGHHRLDSHSGHPLALGIRFHRLVGPHPKSQPLASVRKALEVPVEIGNVHQLLPGRIEIPAPSRHIGLRRAELASVARRRLHQPLDRIGTRKRSD